MTSPYINLQEEENNILGSSALANSLLSGVFPKEKYIKKIEKKYVTPGDINLTKRIIDQDKNMVISSMKYYEKNKEINEQFDEALFNLEKSIKVACSTFRQKIEDKPMSREVDVKMNEFSRETEQNKNKIKKLTDSLPDLQRKKKENEEFFRKFLGEKKVWLDRLKEEKVRDEAYEKGFKYLYEAKTLKLLMEGILLEKVQDKIEMELAEKGEIFGWNIMNEEKLKEERKKRKDELNKKLEQTPDKDAIAKEKEMKKEWEREEKANEQKKEEVVQEWKELWDEIWIPGTKVRDDPDISNKRKLMIKVTMEKTFEIFKTVCFDIWRFKNIILSNEEYVVMDKIRSYFPNKNVPGRLKDEVVINQLMNIIEGIKNEEEVIYCDLSAARQLIDQYSKNTSENTTAVEKLQAIVDKISTVQEIVKKNGEELIRDKVEDIRNLIKELNDDNEKKVFQDNLVNNPRLYDLFLPLTNVLMVESFMTVGRKRNKNYQNKIEKANEEIVNLKGENNEISGKLNLLKEVKDKVGPEIAQDILDQSKDYIKDEMAKSEQILKEVNDSLNRIIQLKNEQQQNIFSFYKNLRKVLVKPKDLC